MAILAFFLPVLPLFALLGFLVFGRYPGHQAIVRLSRYLHRAKRSMARSANPSRQYRGRRIAVPTGGLLIAWGGARRPPPGSLRI